MFALAFFAVLSCFNIELYVLNGNIDRYDEIGKLDNQYIYSMSMDVYDRVVELEETDSLERFNYDAYYDNKIWDDKISFMEYNIKRNGFIDVYNER